MALLTKPKDDEKLQQLRRINKDMHKANKALRNKNKKLSNDVQSWMEKYRITQPLMAFLVKFLRGSQSSLNTIITTLIEYDISDENRSFLVGTVNGNSEINKQIKQKMAKAFYSSIR